jgi:hypothetical protein
MKQTTKTYIDNLILTRGFDNTLQKYVNLYHWYGKQGNKPKMKQYLDAIGYLGDIKETFKLEEK